MPRVRFTENIQRHVSCPDDLVPGTTLHEALVNYFERRPTARSYVLDERGAVRKHVAVFIDGKLIADRQQLSDPVRPDSEVYVFQALSGGCL